MSNTLEQQSAASENGTIPVRTSTAERAHERALTGESYEEACDAVTSVEAIQQFRKALHGKPFGSFYEIVEELGTLEQVGLAPDEHAEHVAHLVEVMEERVSRFSPRVADLYQALLSEIGGGAYETKYDMTATKLDELRREGDLRILTASNASWGLKLNRIETRLADYLAGARALDRREGKTMDDDVRAWRAEELAKAPTSLSEDQDRSKPGVDPMERLQEGEKVEPIWEISPGFDATKYFLEKSFNRWDDDTKEWVGDYRYTEVPPSELPPLAGDAHKDRKLFDITMKARAPGDKWFPIPQTETHSLHDVSAGGRRVLLKRDQNGDMRCMIEGSGMVDVTVRLAADPDKKATSQQEDVVVPYIPSTFSDETEEALARISQKKVGNVHRGRAIASYVRRRVKYLAPKDHEESDRYNTIYRTHPHGFAGAVDEVKAADCDVENTYFSALCARLAIPTRHRVGHSVKGRDTDGVSSIHAGTGHGWTEVWDEVYREWVRVDATSAGDRNLEEEQEKEKKSLRDFIPGDDTDQEALTPTDEELEALRQKLAERKEQLSYTKEERELAEQAGVELAEARSIVREINLAEDTRLPNGERIVDVLARLFNAIVESRRTSRDAYQGPVRRREGGEEIEDVVRHVIGARAGELDPVSRRIYAQESKHEQSIGGFDVYVIGDKSGSMSAQVDGETLWEQQRRDAYLIFSSLHRFSRDLARAGLPHEEALAVRTQGISFRGEGEDDIDLDKPLGSEFTAKDKVAMWHSMTGANGGNGDPQALSYVYEQIKEEIETLRARDDTTQRLRIVIACSDGGYINSEEAMQDLALRLHALGVLTVGIGLTETAASVPVVMENPPYSRGDLVRDVNDLPVVTAKYIIQEAIHLFPDKAREDAERIVAQILTKFGPVGYSEAEPNA